MLLNSVITSYETAYEPWAISIRNIKLTFNSRLRPHLVSDSYYVVKQELYELWSLNINFGQSLIHYLLRNFLSGKYLNCLFEYFIWKLQLNQVLNNFKTSNLLSWWWVKNETKENFNLIRGCYSLHHLHWVRICGSDRSEYIN